MLETRRASPDDVAEIGAIYVDPVHWRRGIGKALMDAAYADLRSGPWGSVALWVFAANEPARAFYGGPGLVPDGTEIVDDRSGAAQVGLRGPIR